MAIRIIYDGEITKVLDEDGVDLVKELQITGVSIDITFIGGSKATLHCLDVRGHQADVHCEDVVLGDGKPLLA